MKHLIISLLIILTAGTATAFSSAPADSTTIADRINEAGFSRVIQPELLNVRLVSTASNDLETDDNHRASATTGGYRIQVFSGNNARTAKREASVRAESIGEQFPEHATYVTYEAPYWRTRIGDFKTYEDASAAMAMIKNAFPAFAREMRLVRSRIKINK